MAELTKKQIYRKAYYAKNKERILAHMHGYYQNNKEAIDEKRRAKLKQKTGRPRSKIGSMGREYQELLCRYEEHDGNIPRKDIIRLEALSELLGRDIEEWRVGADKENYNNSRAPASERKEPQVGTKEWFAFKQNELKYKQRQEMKALRTELGKEARKKERDEEAKEIEAARKRAQNTSLSLGPQRCPVGLPRPMNRESEAHLEQFYNWLREVIVENEHHEHLITENKSLKANPNCKEFEHVIAQLQIDNQTLYNQYVDAIATRDSNYEAQCARIKNLEEILQAFKNKAEKLEAQLEAVAPKVVSNEASTPLP